MREPFDREGWLFELKWDGFRAIAETEPDGGLRLYSRRHNDFTKRFPPVERAGILKRRIRSTSRSGLHYRW